MRRKSLSTKPADTDDRPPARITRARDKDATRQRLQLALSNLTKLGAKLSIKAVATEAGVDPSLVHHVYPDIARQIRGLADTAKHLLADEAQEQASERTRRLRAEVARLQSDLAKLASLNLTLQMRVDELEAKMAGQVALMPRSPGA